MMSLSLGKILGKIVEMAAEAGDSDDIRLRKSLLLGASLLFPPVVIPWIVVLMVYDEPLAAAIPLFYLPASWLACFITLRTKRFNLLLRTQQALILSLPFLSLLVLGGFANSSAIILWSVICPIGTIAVAGPAGARRWLAAYLGLVIASGLLQPILRESNNLPPGLVDLFFVLNIGVVSAVVFILLYYFVREKDRAYVLLNNEQEKSERLLLNVLPKEIAPILKSGKETIADSFQSASILFADLVGFTTLSTELTPAEMVELLNEIFSYFDSLVDKYGLEKIRTIGDSYMVAAGIPNPRPDHAQALANMALEMRDYIGRCSTEDGRRIEFRYGINSGPVVAGVIGRRKFHYDVWGDVVNTASRMESHGVPGKIQIAPSAYGLLKEEFRCEPRGQIRVKGKGDMETWFLTEKRDQGQDRS